MNARTAVAIDYCTEGHFRFISIFCRRLRHVAIDYCTEGHFRPGLEIPPDTKVKLSRKERIALRNTTGSFRLDWKAYRFDQ